MNQKKAPELLEGDAVYYVDWHCCNGPSIEQWRLDNFSPGGYAYISYEDEQRRVPLSFLFSTKEESIMKEIEKLQRAAENLKAHQAYFERLLKKEREESIHGGSTIYWVDWDEETDGEVIIREAIVCAIKDDEVYYYCNDSYNTEYGHKPIDEVYESVEEALEYALEGLEESIVMNQKVKKQLESLFHKAMNDTENNWKMYWNRGLGQP